MSRVLPGHQIPYHFTQAETDTWLRENATARDKSGAKTVAQYVSEAMYGSSDRPYGIVVMPAGQGIGDILIWVDATRHIHVVDITMMPVAGEILKAPYHSPDEGLINNFLKSLENFQSTVVLAIGALVVLQLLKR